MSAVVRTWLPSPPSAELSAALERLARTDDVVHVAVMPDAHVAEDVCVGTVTATTHRLIPAAVGGDIGCGMIALRFEGSADVLADRDRAAEMLAGLYARVPHRAHAVAHAPSLDSEIAPERLSAPALAAFARREGRTEFGTVGRGNHFVEMQRDDDGALWTLVHSGSRAMGPAIRGHHEARSERGASGLRTLEAGSEQGRAYLADAAWASRYASASRARMVEAVVETVRALFNLDVDEASRIEVDHNHVRLEEHGGRALWVHRKGAMGLAADARGVVPGSMGSATYHVEGRGHAEALGSSAHGAGRVMARGEARRRIRPRELVRELGAVWFDHRLVADLCEEAPSAYKDIGKVMRAQHDLVRVVRKLEPILAYKAS